MTRTPYSEYLELRGDWSEVVISGPDADPNYKRRLFDRLADLWRRMNKTERACAGMHAIIAYHGAER